jgi:glucosamine kinase
MYYLGIDGGGSKCKARLEDLAGNLLAESVTGPANPSRDYETAIESIREAIVAVFDTAGLPQSSVKRTRAVIGLAGLNIQNCMHKMQQWEHSFSHLELTTDLHIACVGAHKQEDGAIVIIGTGSSALVCQNHEQHELGGHGFLLGDKASGAWLGKQSVSLLLEQHDGIVCNSPFLIFLKQHIQCNNADDIVQKYISAAPADFAKLAPEVIKFAELDDPHAVSLVKEAAQYINQLCMQILSFKPSRLAFIGGLSEKLIPWLSQEIVNQVSPTLNAPEIGAILIARQQHSLAMNIA